MKITLGKCVGAVSVALCLSACGSGGGSSDKSVSVSASSTSPSPVSVTSSSSAPSGTAASSTSAASSSAAPAPQTSGPSSARRPSGSATPRASASSGVSKPGGGSGGASVAVPKSAAVNISIPSIGLDHSIVPGGLNGGVLNPPSGVIQQFTGYGRVTPGKPGISVLAGHVTYNGPDVFYKLSSAPVGGRVTISYADGTHKDFVITSKASVDKNALQNDSRVWGASAAPVLALVTCDSSSGWVNAQHHTNNFVVWASPA
ncbi:class F sortase [Dermacoccus sp. BD5]|uniref:class F sortase n=1 Tax=Dermacoccus sp. BD5 TaxID=2953656 RepID=UPI0009DD83CB|nr:class F sortase [uncultured Dermacoccus sp.]